MTDRPDTDQPLQPGTVTRLAVQKRDVHRVSVYLDDSFAFGIHQNVLVQFGIVKGQWLDVEAQQEILAAERLRAAKQIALDYLAYKPRTAEEVRRKLERKDVGADTAEAVVERMRELGYLDDAAYAQQFARRRHEVKGYGPRRIQSDLQRRGVARRHVESAVQALREDADLLERAREQARKRWKRLQREPDARRRRKKLSDYLLRRGYSYDTIRQVVDEVQAGEDGL